MDQRIMRIFASEEGSYLMRVGQSTESEAGDSLIWEIQG